MVSAADLSDAELDGFIRARLIISGFDLTRLPTSYDPATGVPTQASLLASLRAFVRSEPGRLNTWRPEPPQDSDVATYAQQVFPPLEYPSITEAWTGPVDR